MCIRDSSQINFSSFNHGFRQRIEQQLATRGINDVVNFGYLSYLTAEFPKVNELLIKNGDGITLDFELLRTHPTETRALIAAARERGLRLGFYFPMAYNEKEEDYEVLLAEAADLVITNFPDRLSDFLHSRSNTERPKSAKQTPEIVIIPPPQE
eukprot:TRINITY_DN3079_c0_g2_i4.p1 TRINITY_DN3079_c0_g2~~TRINITY_DN3079_c0_g2_i4.p1  ORF type:complete len:167 (-),score=51.70 TRINITY_DN3079_c0_g2_i4:94-555(-)